MSVTETPKATCLGLTFYPIPEVTDAEVAFGAKGGRYFHRHNRPKVPQVYEDLVNDLFFAGKPRKDYGIEFCGHLDPEKLRRWVRAMLCSFAPAHEAKTDTVAYALWVWSTPEACPAPETPKEPTP